MEVCRATADPLPRGIGAERLLLVGCVQRSAFHRKDGQSKAFITHDLPLLPEVNLQTQHWIRSGIFEILVKDFRSLVRKLVGRKSKQTMMILVRRTIQSTLELESGVRAGGGASGQKCMLQLTLSAICWRRK